MEGKIENIPILLEYLQYLELECGLSANSLDAYRRDIMEFISLFKISADFKIGYKNITKYLAELSNRGRKPASIARKISALKNFYKYLAEKGYINENPFAFTRVPKISRYHPDYLTVDEMERILKQPDRTKDSGIRDYAILELLYGTGMRTTELINLKISAVYDEVGFIKITGKGNKERLVPFGRFAREAVEKYLETVREPKRSATESDILFLSSRNDKFSRVGIWKVIKKYVLAAGISKTVTPHTFRHSFASHMIEGGADLRTVQELLGHASITTTQIYTQVDKDYLLSMHREFHPRERKKMANPAETNNKGKIIKSISQP